jgi:hypothetical protein
MANGKAIPRQFHSSLLGTTQRDLMPKEAAERLRAAGERHCADGRTRSLI